MHHHHDVPNALREPTSMLRRAIPEVWAGFLSLHVGLALLMGGGTVSVYGPRAWEAYPSFRADVAPVAAAG